MLIAHAAGRQGLRRGRGHRQHIALVDVGELRSHDPRSGQIGAVQSLGQHLEPERLQRLARDRREAQMPGLRGNPAAIAIVGPEEAEALGMLLQPPIQRAEQAPGRKLRGKQQRLGRDASGPGTC